MVMFVLTLKKKKELQTGSSQMHETLHESDAPGAAAFLLFFPWIHRVCFCCTKVSFKSRERTHIVCLEKLERPTPPVQG